MMKTILCSRLVAFLLMAVAVTSTANADTIDLGAGFDAGAQNSFFKIEDNSGFDLTRIVLTATGTGTAAGWSDTWNIADITAGNFSVNYFTQATEAFAANFPSLYATTLVSGGVASENPNSITPSDIAYTLSAVVNGETIQLPFNGGGDTLFLGLDQFGNPTNANDFGYVATASVAAVPLPGAFYLFATGLVSFVVSRKRKQDI